LVIVAGIFYKSLPDIIMLLIGITIFSLDGLDGYLARKFKQVSKFGAYFDMETDAFYVCIFSAILFEKGFVGYWILVPGFMRFFYGTIILLIGRKSKDKIRTKFGPLVAGIFFVSILSPFVLSSVFYLPVLIISSALLLLSFGYSFVQNLSFVSD
jgi:phosphatidylglycerophosphate synthase